MKADLHIHSRISGDGEYSPETLVQMATEEGLELITLTDHNSTRGCGAAAKAAASRDLLFLPGVEIDCAFEGTDMHLLGLGIRAGEPWFETLEKETREKRMALVPAMWENLKKLGIRVNLEEVMAQARGDAPDGEHFAEVLLCGPDAASNPRLQPYLPGGSRSDMPLINFYLDYFAQGKPAHVPMERMHVGEAVDQVLASGGIPVVAHPGLNFKGKEARVSGLLDAGVQGLEVFNNYHTEEQSEFFAGLAKKHKCRMTCGSDFHGKTKPRIRLGMFRDPGSHRGDLDESLEFWADLARRTTGMQTM